MTQGEPLFFAGGFEAEEGEGEEGEEEVGEAQAEDGPSGGQKELAAVERVTHKAVNTCGDEAAVLNRIGKGCEYLFQVAK